MSSIVRSRVLLLALLVAALVVGVAACGGDDSASDAAEAAESAAEDAVEEAGEAVEDAADAVEDAADEALGDTMTVELAEQNGSGVSGTAVITEIDGQLEVGLALDGDDGSAARPAHIHAGSCEELGDVVYPLTDVSGGVSTSMVDATLAELEDGDFAINVHESADAIENYIACGPIG